MKYKQESTQQWQKCRLTIIVSHRYGMLTARSRTVKCWRIGAYYTFLLLRFSKSHSHTHWTRFKNNSSHRTKAHKSADSHLLSLSFAPMIGERMCALFSLNFIQMLFYYASAVLSNVSALPQHHKLFERTQSQKGVTRDMRVHPFAQIS